jgi:hypothetical protein
MASAGLAASAAALNDLDLGGRWPSFASMIPSAKSYDLAAAGYGAAGLR